MSDKKLDNFLTVLTIISVLIIGVYFYWYFAISKYEHTTGTNYIDDQIPVDLIELKDELSEEEIEYFEDRVLFDVNIYSNEQNNGIAMQELQMDYFTDYTLTTGSARSSGMQHMGIIDEESFVMTQVSTSEANQYESELFTYYDTTNMISWTGNKLRNTLTRDDKYIVKIGGKPYQIQLTGTKVWEEYVKTDWSWLLGKKKVTNILHYTFENVFADCMQVVMTNSQKYGTGYVTINLSDYFSVYEFDEESKKFKEDNISDEIFTYATMKFNYHKNGAVKSSQSLFGIIDCNPTYGEDSSVEYWQERVIYSVDESTKINGIEFFETRYSDSFGGYFLNINEEIKSLFSKMPRNELKISLNLDNFGNKNIIGIDYDGFSGIGIGYLYLEKSEMSEFILLENSLAETNLSTIHYFGLMFDTADNFSDKEITFEQVRQNVDLGDTEVVA